MFRYCATVMIYKNNDKTVVYSVYFVNYHIEFSAIFFPVCCSVSQALLMDEVNE